MAFPVFTEPRSTGESYMEVTLVEVKHMSTKFKEFLIILTIAAIISSGVISFGICTHFENQKYFYETLVSSIHNSKDSSESALVVLHIAEDTLERMPQDKALFFLVAFIVVLTIFALILNIRIDRESVDKGN